MKWVSRILFVIKYILLLVYYFGKYLRSWCGIGLYIMFCICLRLRVMDENLVLGGSYGCRELGVISIWLIKIVWVIDSLIFCYFV